MCSKRMGNLIYFQKFGSFLSTNIINNFTRNARTIITGIFIEEHTNIKHYNSGIFNAVIDQIL